MSAKILAAARDIADDIRARPGRAGLSFLAIFVGMVALTVLIAVLGGLNDRARRIVQELGANTFVIQSMPAAGQPAARLSARHAALLSQNLPGCLVASVRFHDVPSAGSVASLRVVATEPALLAIRGWTLAAGRFLDTHDLRTRERSAVAGAGLAQRMQWSVGNSVLVRETPFRLVGIVRAGGAALVEEGGAANIAIGDDVLFVPSSIPPYWLTDRIAPDPETDALFVRVPDGMRMESAIDGARTLLTQPDAGSPSISIVTPADLLERVRRLQRTIQWTVGSIAVLCLVLGGTTLMSLMVANVRDRIPEIGLRRALGATAADIAGLFVIEAIAVTFLAALAAAIATHATLLAAQPDFPVPLRLGWLTAVGPCAIAAMLGMLFSFGPARAAARISPSEALRAE